MKEPECVLTGASARAACTQAMFAEVRCCINLTSTGPAYITTMGFSAQSHLIGPEDMHIYSLQVVHLMRGNKESW